MTPAIRRASALALIAGLGVLGVLGGCGGDDEKSTAAETTPAATATATATPTETAAADSGAGGAQLELEAVEKDGLSFDKKQLTAAAGAVTIKLTSPEGNALPHAVEIEGNGVEEETETIEGGATAEVAVDLKPGEYVFYCPVGQHRERGMEGTLTVE